MNSWGDHDIKRQYDYAVFIGRFQPLHEGHMNVIKQALNLADKVIVLCGSDMRPRTAKNPWTTHERARMINLAVYDLGEQYTNRVVVRGIEDYIYNEDKWLLGVQKTVDEIVYTGFKETPKVCLVGFKKDDTSYYLDKFPQWDLIEVHQQGILSATDVRDFMFRVNALAGTSERVLPKPVARFIKDWMTTPAFTDLRAEFDYLQTHHSNFKFYPYPDALNFVTVDALVVESGHILLVERGKEYGKGLLAMPGGFLNNNERITDAMIRELREETGLKVAEKILKGSLEEVRVFDHEERSLRGRLITHVHKVVLPPCPVGGLSHVQGGDDAADAKWYPLSQVERMRDRLFEDHWDIISEMLGI